MPCLNITNGLFINVDPNLQWKSANATENAPNGTQLQLNNGGPSPGITITRGAATQFFTKFPSGQLHYMRFGNPQNYILVLDVRSSGDRFVTLVDTATTSGITTQSILFVNEPSTVGLPVVHRSQGNGSLFFIYSPSNTATIKSVQICRSDDGTTLCSAVPFGPSGQVTAEATATQLHIKDGGTNVSTCARPAPDCDVIPNQHTFPDAVLGPGVDPSLASHTEQFTIENDGTDCLTITGITNIAPFSVSGTSMPLPVTLDPAESFTVDVLFAPATPGNYSENLPINPTPANGDTVLRCVGEGRPPVLSLTFAGTVGFGRVPLGSSGAASLTITNNGEATVNVNLPASPGGIPFVWSAFAGPITTGASQAIPITFTPVVEGVATHTLTFTSNASGSPHNVQLQGEGCVANAEMAVVVPPGPFVSFGNVQRGFRTVRIARVNNNGDGPLNFRARIQGTDAPLFGIQQEGTSITSPASDVLFTVNPVAPCGVPAGPGEVIFGITFYANDVPGTYTAQLVIDSHNATNVPTPSLAYDLQAVIIPLINIDVELVIDRSGSMGETSGERIKIQTAIDAGRLFVQLARPDVEDRIGLVRFNDTPEVLTGFEIQDITAGNQATIAAAINSGTYSPSGNTSIAGGVRVAVKDIDTHPRATPPAELNTAVVVLTDGKDNTPYTDPDDGVTYSLLGGDGTTALPVPPGKRVYALGIGDSIDAARLGQLAQATGGDFLHVQDFSGLDYFKLEKHFTQIYMDSVDLATISEPTFLIDANDTHVHEFDVLRGDVTFMVVIYDRDGIRLPFYLESPLGEVVELTTIPAGFQLRPGVTNTARFLEVRLPEGEPDRYAGKWRAVIFHDGVACFDPRQVTTTAVVTQPPPSPSNYGFGFRPEQCEEFDDPIMYGIAIGVGSNFRMMPFVQPGIVRVGEPIALNAVVTEFGLPVLGCNVTVEAEAPDGVITHHTLRDDGSHSDGDPDDGDYGKLFTGTHVEGVYGFTFRATGFSRDGEPVVREAFRSKYVEGRVPLDPSTRPGGDDACCRRISLLMRWIIALLVIAILLLLWSILR